MKKHRLFSLVILVAISISCPFSLQAQFVLEFPEEMETSEQPVQVKQPCSPKPSLLRKVEANYAKALSAYQNGLNQQAWKYLKIAENIEYCHAETHLLKATLFEDEKKIDSAILSYKRALAINPDVWNNAYYSLAHLESITGQYAEAEKHYQQFLGRPRISEKMKQKAQMEQLRNQEALQLTTQSVPFSPKNLGININSSYDEYFPMVTVDDSMLIFTRRYMKEEPEPHLEEDFFYSKRDSLGNWTPAQLLPGPINSNDNEGAQFISPDGKYIFFAGCNRRDGYGSCDIYVSRKEGNQWGIPFNLGTPINTEHWESQPCMSSDGKTLYFSSNRPGGYGKSDLWKSTLKPGGIWTEPVNLGPEINTPGDESSPFLHPDGRTLYFSSNGHGGLGGLDLFVSRMDENGKWGIPQNLGYPINTYADEATLSVNAHGDTAYFSSDNLGGEGKKDIYAFALYEQARPTTVSFMRGRVMDARTQEPLAARFQLIHLSNGEVRIESTAERHNGEFFVCLPTGEAFALNVSYPGYLFHSEHIALDGKHKDKPMEKDIFLKPIESGSTITLNNIFYATNQYQLQETSMAELEKLFTFLQQNPSVKVEISGHTDNVGSAGYNLNLSQKRAEAVYEYLVQKGISQDRIIARGYGFEKPVASNETEEGRAQNRRTELKIL